jgi:hypothetical protein
VGGTSSRSFRFLALLFIVLNISDLLPENYVLILWVYTPCNTGDITKVSEEPTAYIFRVEEKREAVGSSELTN